MALSDAVRPGGRWTTDPAGRVGQDARGHARPRRTAIAAHRPPGRRHVPASRRAGNPQTLNTLCNGTRNPALGLAESGWLDVKGGVYRLDEPGGPRN
jgi:hypothetical protein